MENNFFFHTHKKMPRHLNGSKKNPSSGATSKSKAPGDSQGSPNHTTNHSYVEKKYRKIFTKLFAKVGS